MAFTRVYSSSFSFLSAVTRCRHDVFLSFRGEDTRYNITPQLHRALVEAGNPTFKDDVNLDKGGEIASELLKAIQMSRIAIIIFSRNYATSGWCLDELVKIIECKNEGGQVVLPIFYDVDPRDVSQQTGSFAEAFATHEERLRVGNLAENKLEKWRAALTEAASQSQGWDLQEVSSWHQSKFIKEIVKHVMGRHQDAHMSASIFPPSMDSGEEYLNLLLSVISNDVLIIGLCGMGKTAIARTVYNQNCLRFEGSSFLANVSTTAEKPDGLLSLQRQFLSDILREDGFNIDSVERGSEMIKEELGSKRVLGVLDNVNKLDQLNALARRRDWFGSGSRVIITTKDAQLLNVLEVEDVYGDEGIQVIENQLKQNLQTIEDLWELKRRSEAEAYEAEMSLVAEIERERSKSIAQAQIIADLQNGVDRTVPPSALTPTTNIQMKKLEGQGFGHADCDNIVVDFEHGKEIISGNTFAGAQGEMRMPLVMASKDLVEG